MIKLEGIAHDAAPFDVKFPDYPGHNGTSHMFQFTVRDAAGAVAAPATGTVTAKIRTPGGGDFEDVPNNQFQITDRANWIQPLLNTPLEAVQFTLASVEANHTLDVVINSWFGGG